MSARPETRYAVSGGAHLAYQVAGEGPVDLVVTPGFISHLDVQWESVAYRRFVRRLSGAARVIRYDKRGTGLSDPVAEVPTLEQRVEDLTAVLDAVGSAQAVVLGYSEGGPTAIMFAVRRPERCTGLILYGTASMPPPSDVVARFREALARWGQGATLEILAPSVVPSSTQRETAGALERAAASPAMAAALVEAAARIDVTDLLPRITVATLLVHRRDDQVLVEQARYMAAHIPDAVYVELEGADHLPWIGDIDAVLTPMERFLVQRAANRPRKHAEHARARQPEAAGADSPRPSRRWPGWWLRDFPTPTSPDGSSFRDTPSSPTLSTPTPSSACRLASSWRRWRCAIRQKIPDLGDVREPSAAEARFMAATPLTESFWPADRSRPVLETTVGGVLRASAEAAPDDVGLIYAAPDVPGQRRWTFAELLEESERVAAALLQRFEPGERIAVWAPNIPEWVLLEFGAALADVTLVTVNPALRTGELLHILGQSKVAGIFLVPDYRGNPMANSLAEIRPRLPLLRDVVWFADWEQFLSSARADVRLPAVSPDAIAQIMYTSGTTGSPKGVLLHHRGLTNGARLIAETIGAAPGERWLNPNPLFHGAGSGFMTLGPLQLLGAQMLCPFEPGLVLALIESERSAMLGAAATMLELLVRHPDFARRDLSSVRLVAAGGMLVSGDLVVRVEAALGTKFSIGYGQTEAGALTHLTRGDDPLEVKTETVGRPLPQTEVRVADPTTNRTLPVGGIGEVLVRGYHVMAGYFELPEATAAAIDADGWLHTGDLGSMDADGNLRIEGRIKEMIIRGGENIFPREIENVIAQHPAVAAVAVVGVPDPVYGEQVAACVQPVPGATPNPEELHTLCAQQLAHFKVPVRWSFVDEMPRTPLGKIQKFVLQQALREASPGENDPHGAVAR